MLENPLDSRSLQEIYSRTAAFYDQVVAEHQVAAKELAIALLDRRSGERFLEVAFGTAWAFVRVLKASGIEGAVGIEVSPGMLDVGRDRLTSELPRLPALILGDGVRLPFRDATFDCVLCTYTLECLPAALIISTLSEMRRVLSPGGRAIIADLTEGEAEDAELTEEWKRGYARDPAFYGGARPLRLLPLLQDAGFGDLERHYSGHAAGWPTEVVRARR